MQLQVALDVTSLDVALRIANEVKEWIDIVEVGTPLIKAEGMKAVVELRAALKDKVIFADLKTMDAGEIEAKLAFDRGADMISVLGLASDITIKAAVSEANKRKKKVMVDLIRVRDKWKRAQEVEGLGVHFLGIHSGYDEQKQGELPLSDLQYLSTRTSLPLIVAGGINVDLIPSIAKYKPSIIVVGSSIIASSNPRSTAEDIYFAIHNLR